MSTHQPLRINWVVHMLEFVQICIDTITRSIFKALMPTTLRRLLRLRMLRGKHCQKGIKVNNGNEFVTHLIRNHGR
jgi:hypothetical protein